MSDGCKFSEFSYCEMKTAHPIKCTGSVKDKENCPLWKGSIDMR